MLVHHEKRVVHCSQASVFAAIVDIESYPGFVPGWNKAHIRSDENDQMIVDQQLGVGPMRWNFTSVARYHRPDRVTIRAQDGPFKALEIDWKLAETVKNNCAVELQIQAEFSSTLVQRMIKRVLIVSSRNIIDLFEQRAHRYEANIISRNINQ